MWEYVLSEATIFGLIVTLGAWLNGRMIRKIIIQHFERMEQYFEKVEQHFERSDRRFEELSKKMSKGFEEMNKRFEELLKRMDERFNELSSWIQAPQLICETPLHY